jgi:hypothetical protein
MAQEQRIPEDDVEGHGHSRRYSPEDDVEGHGHTRK